MANRVPTLLATAVAAACSLSAHANGPTQADYAKVVLYSNVTIAQDSASQWGVWEELEPTAAGPQTPLPLPQIASGTDPYRPLGVVTQTNNTVAPVCASGALCGFGVMTSYSGSIGKEQAEALGEGNPLRTGFVLVPTVTQANANSDQWLPQTVFVSINSVRTDVQGSSTYSNLGPLELKQGEGGAYHLYESDLPGAYDRAQIETDTSDPGTGSAGKFQGTITIARYVSGGADSPPVSGSYQQDTVYGVWGVTTSAQDMSNLRLSNAQATYSGSTFGADGANTGSVKMSVNFGTSTFSADFNGGLNVKNPLNGKLQMTSSGTAQVNGVLSFSAAGTINGSTFASNALQIAGAGNSITGKVQGAFFGSNAAVAAGVADVTATLVSPSVPPITARYAAPFVTVKDSPVRNLEK